MDACAWKQRYSEAAEAGPQPPGTPPQEATNAGWAIPAQRSPLQALTGSAAKMPRRMRESVADFELRKTGTGSLSPAGMAAMEGLSPRSSQKIASRHHSSLSSGAEENAKPVDISQVSWFCLHALAQLRHIFQWCRYSDISAAHDTFPQRICEKRSSCLT